MLFSASAASFLSGKYGTATIGGPGSGSLVFEFATISWAVNPTAMIVEFINSLSGGHVLRESTFLDVTGSIDSDYDFGNPLWTDASPLPVVGANITNLFLYIRQTASQQYNGPYWTFQSVIVTGNPMNLSVTGKSTYRIPFAGNGKITPPSGTQY